MSHSVVFKGGNEIYQADSCTPLVDAAARGCVHLQAIGHGHYPGRKLPADALPGLKNVGYWDAGHDQDWGLPWHRNEGLELTFLESGSLGFAADDHDFILEPDDLTITRPWQLHRVGLPNVTAGRLHWVILDLGIRRPNHSWKWPEWILLSDHDRDELTNILRHNERPVWHATPDIRRCCKAIACAVESDSGGSSTSTLAVRLNEICVLLLDMLRSQKAALDSSLSSSRRTVQLFLNDLRRHPGHLAFDWSLQVMAEACGLGVTQFISHVKVLVNMTPLHFLKSCRLDMAARLLRESPELSILDVATSCGFCSSQYLATVFAQRFGVSPRDYRKNASIHTFKPAA